MGTSGSRLRHSYVDRSDPVYETEFDNPEELDNWLLEGGLSAKIEKGVLILESRNLPDTERRNQDHLVYWLKQEIPADFLLEFTVRPQDRNKGLNIIFFNARGVNGESIFDPRLEARDGLFKSYTKGDLNSYHISYWSGGRGHANVRKNRGFQLVASGKDMITTGISKSFQKISLYKRSGHIRMAVDDIIAIRYEDDN